MKKILKCFTCLLLTMTILSGCSKTTDDSNTVKILCPVGAPSLAFVSEYENINKEGKIDFVDGSDQLVAELAKNDSEYDIIVAPINLGAKLIESEQTDYRIESVITWGNLYYVGSDVSALNSTGELALFGQGAVPQKIVEVDDIKTTLTPSYYNSATLVQQQLLSGNAKAGLLAEPLASATIAKAKENGITLQIISDLQKAYNDGNGYPQAAIFVKNNKNYDDLFSKIDSFTNDGYTNLEDYLTKIGIETLKLPSIKITVNSIERQNLHYKKANDVKNDIKDFLKLFNITYSDDMLSS